MNFALIKILALFKPFFRWQKINYAQLENIVATKLTMDNRRTSGININRNTSESENAFLLSLFVFSILSIFLAFLLYSIPSKIFAFTLFHAYLMVMVTLILVGDFSFVLLDTSDNTILLPRPIDTKTFYAARTTHILFYILQIVIALSFIPCLAAFFKYGIATGLMCVITIVLSVSLSVSITNGLYLVLMRFFHEEQLKNIINYFQIAMAILFMGVYQLMPRLYGLELWNKFTGTLPLWSVFIPPMWMAALIEWCTHFSMDFIYVTCSILAIASPFATWKLINNYLAPYFASKIADLGITSTAKRSITKKSNKKREYFVGSDVQKSGYSIVSFALSRDRKLKLRIYPVLGYMVVLAIVILSQSVESPGNWLDYIHALRETKAYLTLIYLGIFIMITVSYEINMTDEFKAAWIFFTAPIPKPGEVLAGAFKAIMARIFIPVYFFVLLIILSIWQEKAILDLIFGFISSLFLMLVILNLGDKYFPQSVAMSERSKGANTVRAIFSMIIIGLMGLGHYMISKNSLVLISLGISLAVANYFLYKRYKNLSWDEIS